jgi:hypothetical protein
MSDTSGTRIAMGADRMVGAKPSRPVGAPPAVQVSGPSKRFGSIAQLRSFRRAVSVSSPSTGKRMLATAHSRCAHAPLSDMRA